MFFDITALGALIGLGIAIVLIFFKVPPVFCMLLGALVGGLIGGLGLEATISAMTVGAEGMLASSLRILTSGVLVGALVITKSTDKIAESIIRVLGVRLSIPAIALASMLICGIGIFIPIAVITVAPIALEIGKRAHISNIALLMAMIGGGKAGNIISPNPNTLVVAEAFDLGVSELMIKNLFPAIIALLLTIFISYLIAGSHAKASGAKIDYSLKLTKDTSLPSFTKAIVGPLFVIVVLILCPALGVNIDPLIVLPAGGILCIFVTGHYKSLPKALEFGLSKVAGICLILIATGTLAGIIKASTLQIGMISLLEATNLPIFLLAPISGALLAAATASTTAGAAISSQTFASALISSGVPALSAGAMINASATIIDSMPHGSFFHASADAGKITIKERLKLIPLEASIGLSATLVNIIIYIFIP